MLSLECCCIVLTKEAVVIQSHFPRMFIYYKRWMHWVWIVSCITPMPHKVGLWCISHCPTRPFLFSRCTNVTCRFQPRSYSQCMHGPCKTGTLLRIRLYDYQRFHPYPMNLIVPAVFWDFILFKMRNLFFQASPDVVHKKKFLLDRKQLPLTTAIVSDWCDTQIDAFTLFHHKTLVNQNSVIKIKRPTSIQTYPSSKRLLTISPYGKYRLVVFKGTCLLYVENN